MGEHSCDVSSCNQRNTGCPLRKKNKQLGTRQIHLKFPYTKLDLIPNSQILLKRHRSRVISGTFKKPFCKRIID